MSDLPNRLPGQAPEGQSAADIEAAMKAEGARQAMMDDLGIARVENLPLDDGSRDRVRGQRGHHAEPDPNRRQPPLRRSPAGPSLPGVNGAAWGMNQAWQDAMEARIFDDDDAEAVKDLDDLGGGRLYDTGDGSQKARVSHMTMRILNQRSVRSGHQPVGRPAASKGGRPSQGPAEFGRNNISAAATSSSHRGNNSRASAPSANSKPKANNVNPRARLANQPRARPRPALPVAPPMPETAIDPDAALSFEIENVILKIVVKFSSRDINPALPALVVLSTAAPPELGFLTVVIYNNKYCEWAMSAWLDYSTGDDNRLGITFQNGGVYQGYELQFGSQDGLREFMAAARALQTGKHPNQVGSASVPATTVVTIPVSNMLAPEPPRKTLIPGDVSLQAASPQAPAPQNVPPATRTAPGPMALAEPIAVLAAPDVSQVLPPPDVPPATPTALSPVVVPEPTAAPETPDVNDTDAASMKAFRDAAIVTCRTLLQFFYHSGAAGGSTTTVGDMDQTAEGIKSGVLEHTMESARAMGLGEQKIHMLRDAINVYFAPQPTPQPTPQPVSCEVQRALTIPRRIYSIDFLLSRRDAAVNPPRSLPNIPGLPQPGSSSRGRASSHQKGTVDQSQFSRSADAMQWVLREAPLTKPEPKEFKSAPDTTPRAPENTQPTAPNVVGLGGTPDTGLNNSRWASSALEIKNANYFTGPRYEKTWAKRTYLEELAQLDPETRITAPTEDMMEYYFPLPDADKAQSGSQASVVDGSPAPGTLGETYKMEHLNTDMSRLSIRSPTAPRSRSARLAASAETSGAAQTPSPPSAMTPPLVSAVSSQSPASTPSATCLEAEATPRFSQPTRVISALPATYLETQTASRLSTSAISSPSMILTSPTMSSAAQTPSHPSAMSPPVVPRVSSQSSVSIAEVPNRLRSEHGPQPPALAQTEASTPPGPLNPAPRQFPLVPAQPPAPPAAQPRVRGLAASRHSDGTAPTSSGKFNFYVPHSARQ
ncbi:uncharacterized protein B0H64DRAFT_456442 [Chaetomium fimeti]|uniref:Uncharacterized protein n=1 Tax=Chaetomium fimeti TaxID=1854472 RepID=A0AAE0HIG2_9PEZI|nr:hypothetical protein B0H64DRAFT_456442 [Chaetomium fimeti]